MCLAYVLINRSTTTRKNSTSNNRTLGESMRSYERSDDGDVVAVMEPVVEVAVGSLGSRPVTSRRNRRRGKKRRRSVVTLDDDGSEASNAAAGGTESASSGSYGRKRKQQKIAEPDASAPYVCAAFLCLRVITTILFGLAGCFFDTLP